jgi:hypothetical protein
MARSRVANGGNRVLLSLTFTEAAALEALLCRVDEETHEGIYATTLEVWDQLRDRRDELVAAGLWPDYFESFRELEVPLYDPCGLMNEDDDFEMLGGEG